MRIIATLLMLGLLPGAATAETLATVGKKTISRSDVEDSVKSELAEVEAARYKALRGGLDELVAMALIEQEAAARGVSVEELTKVEITDKVAKPSDAEIQKVYDDNKEQLQGAPLDQVKPQIVEYLSRKGTADRQQAYLAELKKKYPTKIELKPPTVEVAVGSTPFQGKDKAPITIIEFSDYECPYCRQAHAQLRNIVAQFPERVRLVHRHFPLDQACNRSIERPFHQTACRAALVAECAASVGHFWEANDYLFQASNYLDTQSNEKMAADLNLDPAALDRCMKGEGLAAVKNDIEVGVALKLEGTPSFLVDGQVYMGNLPAAVLERLRAMPDSGR